MVLPQKKKVAKKNTVSPKFASSKQAKQLNLSMSYTSQTLTVQKSCTVYMWMHNVHKDTTLGSTDQKQYELH